MSDHGNSDAASLSTKWHKTTQMMVRTAPGTTDGLALTHLPHHIHALSMLCTMPQNTSKKGSWEERDGLTGTMKHLHYWEMAPEERSAAKDELTSQP